MPLPLHLSLGIDHGEAAMQVFAGRADMSSIAQLLTVEIGQIKIGCSNIRRPRRKGLGKRLVKAQMADFSIHFVIPLKGMFHPSSWKAKADENT